MATIVTLPVVRLSNEHEVPPHVTQKSDDYHLHAPVVRARYVQWLGLCRLGKKCWGCRKRRKAGSLRSFGNPAKDWIANDPIENVVAQQSRDSQVEA
ncbi:hypothetical protein BH10PLA2_BH10PLA2_40020 [soil metagenome]